MESLLQRLTQHSGEMLLAISLLSLILLVMVAALWKRSRSHSARWQELLRGKRGEDLEKILLDHLRERLQLRSDLETATERIRVLEEKMRTSKRHLGLVRYDAFEDVGGSQSFALALFDDRGNGAILNSLIGRSDCRVYCKPLVDGRSERHLSQEEQRAMSQAQDESPRPILS